MKKIVCPTCGASPVYYVDDKTVFRFWCRECKESKAVPMHQAEGPSAVSMNRKEKGPSIGNRS